METTPGIVKTIPFAIGTKWNQTGTKPKRWKPYIYFNVESSGTNLKCCKEYIYSNMKPSGTKLKLCK